MSKIFTSGLKAWMVCLGLLTVAGATAQGEKKEWREVFTVDFGGNEESDPPMSETEPSASEITTSLEFSPTLSGQPNKYFIAKSADQVTRTAGGVTYNAADGNTWLKGGDHTYPNTDQQGYFMMFDCPEDNRNDVVIFSRTLPVSCTGVKFRFSAWFANMSKAGSLCNVNIMMEDANGKTIKELGKWNIPAGRDKVDWINKEIEFHVSDPAITEVYFKIKAVKPAANGFDFAIDDIAVSVEQPVLEISNDTEFNYKHPVSLVAKYDQTEFENFFGDNYSGVKYKWEYSETGTPGSFSKLNEGNYSAGSDMAYKIDAFEKAKHNGFYKLTVATSGNMDNSLCSIQKIYQINETKDKATVTICEEGKEASYTGKVDFYGTEISYSSTPQTVNGSITVTTLKHEVTMLPEQVNPQCKNSDFPTPGKTLIETEKSYKAPTYKLIGDTRQCVDTKKEIYRNVTEGEQDANPMKLCKGDTYTTPGESTAKVYDELGPHEVTFDSSGCRYKRIITVYNTSESEEDVYICVGDEYGGTTYTKAGAGIKGTPYFTKNADGCKHTVTPMITVSEPVVEDLGTVVRCSNEPPYVFGDKTYSEPMDEDLEYEEDMPNGCKKTTKLHLTIHPSGEIGPFDTLICRDQILFGKEYAEAGRYLVKRSGTTSNGCDVDTIWNIQVVEIQLRLRVAFGQKDVCEGSELELRADLTPANASYRWEPKVPNNSLRPTIMPEQTTTYVVYADLDLPSDIDGDAKGCHATDSITITVYPQPSLAIDSVNADEKWIEATIDGGTRPYNIYVNKKTDEQKPTEGNYMDSYIKLEKQYFGNHTLTVIDSAGCSAEEDYSIEPKPIEMPDFFTPNHDGENDVWYNTDLLSYPKAILRIYDRYGKEVYRGTGEEASNGDTGFDGNYNGKPLPSADYWYEISIDEIDKTYVGHFTLLR